MENEAPKPVRRGRRRSDPELPVTNDRPAMRAEMREEDPRIAAARRAKEIMGHVDDVAPGVDEFRAPRAPDGWTYEWKRHTILNQEDPAYRSQLERTGWEPVPAGRHKDMMAAGYKGGTIERKGMILMQRPQEITDHFRNLDRRAAKDQVRIKEGQLNSAPQGQFERDHEQARAKINKSFEPMPIPKD